MCSVPRNNNNRDILSPLATIGSKHIQISRAVDVVLVCYKIGLLYSIVAQMLLMTII